MLLLLQALKPWAITNSNMDGTHYLNCLWLWILQAALGQKENLRAGRERILREQHHCEDLPHHLQCPSPASLLAPTRNNSFIRSPVNTRKWNQSGGIMYTWLGMIVLSFYYMEIWIAYCKKWVFFTLKFFSFSWKLIQVNYLG